MTSPNRYTWPLRLLRYTGLVAFAGVWYRTTLWLMASQSVPLWANITAAFILTLAALAGLALVILILLWAWNAET